MNQEIPARDHESRNGKQFKLLDSLNIRDVDSDSLNSDLHTEDSLRAD